MDRVSALVIALGLIGAAMITGYYLNNLAETLRSDAPDVVPISIDVPAEFKIVLEWPEEPLQHKVVKASLQHDGYLTLAHHMRQPVDLNLNAGGIEGFRVRLNHQFLRVSDPPTFILRHETPQRRDSIPRLQIEQR